MFMGELVGSVCSSREGRGDELPSTNSTFARVDEEEDKIPVDTEASKTFRVDKRKDV